MSNSQAVQSPSLAAVVAEAAEAFWAKVATLYPMVKTGDLPMSAQMMFERACEQAIVTWLGNLPSGAVIVTKDGERLVKQEDGVYYDASRDTTLASLHDLPSPFCAEGAPE